ncbi:TetR/AcrR family transcriptional regulator [Actinocrispum sp. NPDC049592]|uniref:TetR/AcrR family transcriptional regulator n=1 Tax=Actinocrispum sp. NPDC049592 TaxID=3154835 RepID=UPI00341B7FC0
MTKPMSGRRAQAARNDEVILRSAREVFLADPSAPIAAVAEHAGVGISALYRRYPSKEDLLRKLCADGLAQYTAVAEAAVTDEGDPWEVFERFMAGIVATRSSSLVRHLAGMFTPSEELYHASAYAGTLNDRIFERAQQAGVIRPDVNVNDMALIFEMVEAVTIGDEARRRELRGRYLALLLDGIRVSSSVLPGRAPEDRELSSRWDPGT